MESVKKTSGEADALAQFIEDKFLVSFSDGTLSYDSDLFENGVIDSFGVIEIVTFIQEQFGIELEPDDLMSELLASVTGLAELVQQKAGA